MASSVVQAVNSIGDGITGLGKKFKDATGWDNMGRIGEAIATGGVSLYTNAIDDANNAATARVQTQNQAENERVAKKLEDEDILVKQNEAKNVMNAKKNSSARSASGRQGTMSGGTLLGGGDSSIGSKTLLGQ